MAGIDGIENKIDPGEAADKNLYDLPPEEEALIPDCGRKSRNCLKSFKTRSCFLLKGDVFSKDMIDAYIDLKCKKFIN